MRRVEHWALGDGDQDLVARLSAGLGEDPARVLAYLLGRRTHDAVEDDRATQLDVRVGTGLGRGAAIDALSLLGDRNLVSETTLPVERQGRPPTAWRAAADRPETLARVYDAHGRALLERAVAERTSEDGTAPEAKPRSGSDEVTVGLNWRPNALHLPLFAAEHCDAFAERGLATEWRHMRGSHHVIEALTDGAVDVGVVGAGNVVRARATGAPIVPVAVLYQRATTVLYTTRSQFGEPLESVAQLRGRRVATAVGSETWLLCRLFLANAGLLDEVSFVDTAGEEHEALLTGEADVATGAFSDPGEVDTADVTVDTLSITDHFPVYGPVLVVPEATLSGAPSLVERSLAAVTEGWGVAQVDPGPAARAVAAESEAAPSSVESTFADAAARFGASDAVTDRGWGWQRPEVWERLELALDRDDSLPEAP